jgi:uncharacterized protein (DUF305 family)
MNNTFITGLLALIIGIGIGYMVFGAKSPTVNTHTMPDGTSMSDTMQGMTAGLQGKTGAEFDKAFTEEMIVHHEGAVDMAKLALQNAERPEIKQLAEAIIQAQTIEINMMQGWLKDWFGR